MPVSKGDRIGRYQILALVGKGGMGEVYRARDSRLSRYVAIKISSAQFTERFTREARAIAAFNHTNICHLYDVGPDYLVMEYVEGEDLRGPLNFDDTLPIIRQLIDGIEAAHERNIIHRDLKPANIKITPEGVVKILDFGLAKVMEPSPSQAGDPENSPTITGAATQAGAILGTAAYMAPEQARGKAADKRSDIWSFGVILHELLTGKRLFQGESTVEILGGVLNKEPDISAAPPRARKLLRWCLEKDRKQRLQAIGDARRMLEAEPESDPLASAPRFGIAGNAGGLAAGVVLLLALGALSFLHFREKPPVKEMVRFEISPPANVTFASSAALSPDGRKLAYAATAAGRKPMLWVRSLDSEEARPLAGTEGGYGPIWSPDSRFLAFASGGKLKEIEATGGPAQTLCDSPAASDDPAAVGGAWTSDDRILFGTYGPLQLVSAAGGTPTPLTTLDQSRNELGHLYPAVLPDGHHFLYWRISIPSERGGVYIGDLD